MPRHVLLDLERELLMIHPVQLPLARIYFVFRVGYSFELGHECLEPKMC